MKYVFMLFMLFSAMSVADECSHPAAPASQEIDGWSICACEQEACHFEGEQSILYGVPGSNVTKNFTASESPVDCINTVFSDPIPGTFKACYLEDEPVAPKNTIGVIDHADCVTHRLHIHEALGRDSAYCAENYKVVQHQCSTNIHDPSAGEFCIVDEDSIHVQTEGNDMPVGMIQCCRVVEIMIDE